MKPSTELRHFISEHPNAFRYVEAIAALLNRAAQHVSANRVQMAETPLGEARKRVRALLPMSKEDFERIGADEGQEAGTEEMGAELFDGEG